MNKLYALASLKEGGEARYLCRSGEELTTDEGFSPRTLLFHSEANAGLFTLIYKTVAAHHELYVQEVGAEYSRYVLNHITFTKPPVVLCKQGQYLCYNHCRGQYEFWPNALAAKPMISEEVIDYYLMHHPQAEPVPYLPILEQAAMQALPA